ncbi:MAG TPA: Holliday junction branch migration protein RuvA [Nitrolancea sp.]|nr:Holliday junction branch migration protein RuvA [Nitrolancea sp.]
MIAGVRGRIAGRLPGTVLVDLHGLILQVLTSATTLSDIGETGSEVELVTHLHVREDALTLFGFATQDELRLFLLLLGVTGVGPKAALSILSTARPAELARAIEAGDADLLSRAPGIGRKTANRIILDLRGKLPEQVEGPTGPIEPADVEALEALRALGYSAVEARTALSQLEPQPGQTVEQRVFAALQQLARA